MQARGGEKDGGDVEVADHSNQLVVIEGNAQASREVYGRELGMSNREKTWVMAGLWSKVNSVSIFSSVDGCMDHRSRASGISTLVANSKSSTVPKILAFATPGLDADRDDSDADGDYSVCSGAVKKGTIGVLALVARQQ